MLDKRWSLLSHSFWNFGLIAVNKQNRGRDAQMELKLSEFLTVADGETSERPVENKITSNMLILVSVV